MDRAQVSIHFERCEGLTTDAAVSDLNVKVRLMPCFWLVVLPFHVAFSGGWVYAHPSLELVIAIHIRSRACTMEEKKP